MARRCLRRMLPEKDVSARSSVLAILPHNGASGRYYRELKAFMSEYGGLLRQLQGSMPMNQAGILFSYEQEWALEIQPHHPELRYVFHLMSYYSALYRRNIPVDFVHEHQSWDAYGVLIAPLLETPAGVEAVHCEKDGVRYLFGLNHTGQAQPLEVQPVGAAVWMEDKVTEARNLPRGGNINSQDFASAGACRGRRSPVRLSDRSATSIGASKLACFGRFPQHSLCRHWRRALLSPLHSFGAAPYRLQWYCLSKLIQIDFLTGIAHIKSSSLIFVHDKSSL